MGWAALGMAVTLALAGCGGDDASDAGPSTTAAVATTSGSSGAASAATVSTDSAAPTTTAAPAPTVGASPTSQTTAPAAASGPSWEQIKDAAIPGLCNHPPTQLVDGRDASLGPNDGAFALVPALEGGTSGIVSGLRTSEGTPVTAVLAECNAGGVAWPHLLLFFSGSGTYETSTMLDEFDWASIGLQGPGRNGISELGSDGAQLEVVLRAERPSDPSCCPSAWAKAHVAMAGGRATVTDAVVVER